MRTRPWCPRIGLALLGMGLTAPLLLGACDPVGSGRNAAAEDRTGYPAAPYGVAEGEVLQDLAFLRTDGTEFALHDIYRDGANRLLLAVTAAWWCSACVEEQPDLEALYDQYAARGLHVLVAIFQDADYQAATAADAERWQRQFELSPTVVADPDFGFGAYYDSTLTPMNMLVDVVSMQIVRIQTGWDPSAVEALIQSRLP